MKYIFTLSAIALVAMVTPVSAQGLNVYVDADLKTQTGVNANVGSQIKATGTPGTIKVDTKVKTTGNATSSATREDNKNQGSTTDSSDKGSDVSIKARTVRGWSDTEKEQFMLTVKGHAQVQSGQDLENFATGILVKDDNTTAVEVDDDTVEVKYKLPAKFLGIFSTQLETSANVDVSETGNAGGQKEVTVKFPWYRIFFSLSEEARAEVIEAAIQSSVDAQASASTTVSVSSKARTVQLVNDILKSIRSKVEVEADVSNE